ncbi:MAG: hypothetical protein F9K29_03580 [Hyphomicrobiaceae bacterium]|nr:MAG: hypothetical protein F9K29_03580 [Hyphomicrobiaceae bacterium]
MSQLVEVLADCVALAQVDKRLSVEERMLLEGIGACLDAHREGMFITDFIAKIEAEVAAEDAALEKQRARAAAKAKRSNKRRQRGIPARKSSRRSTAPTRRAA